jgi:hypothetical protein
VLHHVASLGPSLEVVKTIYGAYPPAIYENNTALRTPLHLYTMKGCDPLVVEFLLQQYPLALSAWDIGYDLPIHWLTGCHFSVHLYDDMNLRNELYVDTMSSLHLHSLLQSKPTDSLVKLFLSNFPEAVRVRDGESWTILMHGQIIERSSLSTKRMLILHSVERNTMSLQLRFITPELAKTIVEEANDHPEISKLVLYVNDKMDLESHQALLEALGQATKVLSFSLKAPARHDLPISAGHALSNFSRSTRRCNTSTSTYAITALLLRAYVKTRKFNSWWYMSNMTPQTIFMVSQDSFEPTTA